MKYRNSISVAIEVIIEGRLRTIKAGQVIKVSEPLKAYQGILVPVSEDAVDEIVEVIVPETKEPVKEQTIQSLTEIPSDRIHIRLNSGKEVVNTENLTLTRDSKGRLFNPDVSEKDIIAVTKKLDIKKDDIKIIIEADVARSRAETKRIAALERKKKKRLERRIAKEEINNEQNEKSQAEELELINEDDEA
jgi:hypothetical protein